jgi:polyferredoxin
MPSGPRDSILPHPAVFAATLAVTVGAWSVAARLWSLDQRAFCKYLCPSAAILRWTSRPALLRIAAQAEACDGCGACTRACPMDIEVAPLARAGRRIGSGDCVLCQRCVQACTRGALRLTFGSSRAPLAREVAARA